MWNVELIASGNCHEQHAAAWEELSFYGFDCKMSEYDLFCLQYNLTH